VYARNALVPTVCYGLCVLLEMYLGVFEQTKVMGFAWCKVGTDDLFVLLVDGQLAFGGVAFLLA
jgi:hypothetical protein